MKALIQRVKRASIAVADHPVADIGPGLLVMVGFEPADDDDRVGKLIRRCIAYRVFADDSGRFARGDVETADADLVHQPVAEPGEDCICLAVTDAPLRFRSPLARLAGRSPSSRSMEKPPRAAT